jgi:hypothetical protein
MELSSGNVEKTFKQLTSKSLVHLEKLEVSQRFKNWENVEPRS